MSQDQNTSTGNGNGNDNEDSFDTGRWMVLRGFTEDLEPLNGRIGVIIEEDVIDRYVIEVPASDLIEQTRIVADKSNLMPVSERVALSMQEGSKDIEDGTGEISPCYQHWDAEHQQVLLSHIDNVAKYNATADSLVPVRPKIPEWYLYSLKASLRKWGMVPADFADVPPMMHANERCIHFEPRNGFLEVTLMLKNREWRNRERAMKEVLSIVKSSVVSGQDQATLVHFEASSGGHPGPACEDTTAVFIVNKVGSPLTVVKPPGSIPEVLMRMY